MNVDVSNVIFGTELVFLRKTESNPNRSLTVNTLALRMKFIYIQQFRAYRKFCFFPLLLLPLRCLCHYVSFGFPFSFAFTKVKLVESPCKRRG